MKKRVALISVVSLFTFLFLPFQNCSKITFRQLEDQDSNPGDSDIIGPKNNELPLPISTLPPSMTAPGSLNLTHVPNSKQIEISFTGGSNIGPCFLQHQSANDEWQTFGELDCDSDLSSTLVNLPETPTFPLMNSTWNDITVRLITSDNETVLGTFEEKLTCQTLASSPTETPDIDENCNGLWNEPPTRTNCNRMTGNNNSTFSEGAQYTFTLTGVTELQFGRWASVYNAWDSSCTSTPESKLIWSSKIPVTSGMNSVTIPSQAFPGSGSPNWMTISSNSAFEPNFSIPISTPTTECNTSPGSTSSVKLNETTQSNTWDYVRIFYRESSCVETVSYN